MRRDHNTTTAALTAPHAAWKESTALRRGARVGGGRIQRGAAAGPCARMGQDREAGDSEWGAGSPKPRYSDGCRGAEAQRLRMWEEWVGVVRAGGAALS